MIWRLFATKLETAKTMEGVALNMRAPYFYPPSTQIGVSCDDLDTSWTFPESVVEKTLRKSPRNCNVFVFLLPSISV